MYMALIQNMVPVPFLAYRPVGVKKLKRGSLRALVTPRDGGGRRVVRWRGRMCFRRPQC